MEDDLFDSPEFEEKLQDVLHASIAVEIANNQTLALMNSPTEGESKDYKITESQITKVERKYLNDEGDYNLHVHANVKVLPSSEKIFPVSISLQLPDVEPKA
jgi:hypothetical protein